MLRQHWCKDCSGGFVLRGGGLQCCSILCHGTAHWLTECLTGFQPTLCHELTACYSSCLVFSCFLLLFFLFPSFLDLVSCKVKLKSNSTISVMKCKQMWLFHVTLLWGPWVCLAPQTTSISPRFSTACPPVWIPKLLSVHCRMMIRETAFKFSTCT